MSVTYMLALEEEPSSYEKLFSQLTKGINNQVQEWILLQTTGKLRILEVGCGPGTLAKKLAEKGHQLVAIDQDPKMVSYAQKTLVSGNKLDLIFRKGYAQEFPKDIGKFDLIISTFMLSELPVFEQQIFLREAWTNLKDDGQLIIAEEFEPTGLAKLGFNLKRSWYKYLLNRKKKGETHPLKHFVQYLEPIGFKLIAEQTWKHNSIRALKIQKINKEKPRFYQPPTHSFTGIKAWGRVIRCLTTGQIDHVPIEPGIYRSGNPTPDSPVIVTANYEYTYYRVMRDLRGINAWVLCVDSNGINVWCAARGDDFGNQQLVIAVQASGLEHIVNHRNLILPQLAAGGVAVPELVKMKFPFKVHYGPVWSKDLKEYLATKPVQKPESMRVAKFTLTKRLEAGFTHLTFNLRMFLLLPTIIALVVLGSLSLIFPNTTMTPIWNEGLIWIRNIWISVIFTNFSIAVLFPLAEITPIFIKKGATLSLMNAILQTIMWYFINPNWIYLIPQIILIFWYGFFATMSFSGYTFHTEFGQISKEYPVFIKLNILILVLSAISYIIVILLDVYII